MWPVGVVVGVARTAVVVARLLRRVVVWRIVVG
jgi:hypothetical protein